MFFLKDKHTEKISVAVVDLQTSPLRLIYQAEFYDYNLKIGDNVLSQNWRQKLLAANYFSDKNTFKYAIFTFTINIVP